jgi:hypothetical protein
MKLQKMKYLDNKQDIGTEEEDSKEPTGMNLKEYQDELDQLMGWCKKSLGKMQGFTPTDLPEK